MKKNVFVRYFLLCICLQLSSSVRETDICGKYKYMEFKKVSFLYVTCSNENANDSSKGIETEKYVCTDSLINNVEYDDLNDEDFLYVTEIELRNCSFRPGITGTRNFAKLSTFTSTYTTNGVLQNNSFQGFCSLLNINLGNNSIEVVQSSAFVCLFRVRDLDLSYNRIELFPDNIFNELRSLRTLFLNDNKLRTLSEGIFDNLKVLENLYLSYNRIEMLNEHILTNLTELKDLDISNNYLTQLPSILTNTELEELDISKNKGIILLKQTLRGLFNLENLYLDGCNITSIPDGLFTDTQNVSDINMMQNNLQIIKTHTFTQLENLKTLYLSFNYISELQDQPFRNNKNLVYLYLQYNSISEVRKDFFQGLSSLKVLYLSNNNISSIFGNAFDSLLQLEVLHIDNNFVSTLHGSHPFGISKKLARVNFSYNRLTDISYVDWDQFPSLERLVANNNKIKEVFLSDFSKNYLTVRLEDNEIRRIYLNSAKKQNITFIGKEIYIYFTGNSIECDCHAYNLYANLHNVFMSNFFFVGGLVCRFPNEFNGVELKTLKSTDFTCNIPEMCPEKCSCTYRARDNANIVNCSNRGYFSIPTQAPFNTSILDMSHNNLTSLASLDDKDWENLTEIHAEHNEIHALDLLQLPKQMKVLRLSHNKLINFPESIKNLCERTNCEITISNNLWSCDCSIIVFNHYVLNHKNQIMDINDVSCTLPNKSWIVVSEIGLIDEEICPGFNYIPFVIFSAVSVFNVFFALIFYYKHKLSVLSFLYSHCNTFYMLMCCSRNVLEDKLYDCFISYSSEDREVIFAILEELENKPPFYEFCIHERNWVPGHYITSNITESVENSRKTLIIISKTFLKSSWFYLEFQAAYHKTLEDKRDRLIIVLKGELPDEEELDSDVLYVLSSKTYLQWGERWFWEKLRYAIYSENYSPEQESSFCFRRLALWCINKKSLGEEDVELIAGN